MSLDDVIKNINKKYKKDLITEGSIELQFNRIPFSDPRMNYMTYGGIPLGRMSEFYGAEGSGKTTTALDLVAQAQIAFPDRKVVYIDAENTLDESWAKLLGVNLDKLILIRPDSESAEEILQIMLDLIDTSEVVLMVLDSVPMLVSQAALGKTMEEKTYCGIAGPLTTFCQKVTQKLITNDTCLLFINQVRDVLNSMYPQVGTPGGKALKHSYAVRLMFNKGKFLDDKNNEANNNCETPYGNIVEVKVTKTKAFKPDRRVGSYLLKYYDGIDVITDTIFTAIFLGLIKQGGAWFTLLDDSGEPLEDAEGNIMKFQGKNNLADYLKSDEFMFQELLDKCYQKSL